jgi:hypothetical protein
MSIWHEISLTNTGWETGSFAGWTYSYSGGHSTILQVKNTDKHTGTYSVYGVCPFAGTEYGRLDQSVPDWEQYKGKTVKWTLWSHILFQGVGDAIRVRIIDGVTDPDGYTEWAWSAVEADWTEHSNSYTFPSNATEFTIRIWYDWHYPSQVANLRGYIDDFKLEWEQETNVYPTYDGTRVTGLVHHYNRYQPRAYILEAIVGDLETSYEPTLPNADFEKKIEEILEKEPSPEPPQSDIEGLINIPMPELPEIDETLSAKQTSQNIGFNGIPTTIKGKLTPIESNPEIEKIKRQLKGEMPVPERIRLEKKLQELEGE